MSSDCGGKKKEELGFLRLLLWPMKKDETFIVLSLFFILFSILFNYSILRICKDSLLINAPNAGAEVIPFVKIWGVTPFAFLLTAVHLKISSVWNREKVFHVTMGAFLGFFVLFSFFLFPNLEQFGLNHFSDLMESIFPIGFKGFFTMFRNWSVSLFYILAELWASIIMALLFWGFANDVTRIEDAKRFYVFFALGGHLSNTFAGELVTVLTERFSDVTSQASLNVLLNYLTIVMVISGGISMILFHYVYKRVARCECPTFALPEVTALKNKNSKKKVRMGLVESLMYVVRSKYLRNLAIMVIAYGFTINLIEITWKGQMKELFGGAMEYMNYMAKLHIYMSFISIAMLIFCGPMLRRWGWGVTALVAPIVMLVSGVLFFGVTMFNDYSVISFTILGLSPLALSVWIGFWQNSFSKGAKNTLFSVTKEMAYIPLDPDTRLQGKAAIDVLGERLGKLGGSGVSMFLLFFLGQVAATTPYVAFFMIGLCILWVRATFVLKKEVERIERGEMQEGDYIPEKEEGNNDRELSPA